MRKKQLKQLKKVERFSNENADHAPERERERERQTSCYLGAQTLQEGTDVLCARWRLRKVEIFPADNCIGHTDMLIKLSKCKTMICHLAPPHQDFK